MKPRLKRPVRGLKCSFCESDEKPDYKEIEILKNFIDDRGKIIPRIRSGVCAKHQRRLAQSIKRARYLGLIPFTTQP
ncbi:30S ribosomal protein S18 [Microgenomates group bacterium RBG_19FT_COMBO_39_10]|nr:MAG: 30S ribosomal protein S18 [Microgenomates group bacterium RBG_19FT_COMBO_39_10]